MNIKELIGKVVTIQDIRRMKSIFIKELDIKTKILLGIFATIIVYLLIKKLFITLAVIFTLYVVTPDTWKSKIKSQLNKLRKVQWN